MSRGRRESQAGSALSAQGLTWGSNPHTTRSRPEPKSDASPTEPPRRPTGFSKHNTILDFVKTQSRMEKKKKFKSDLLMENNSGIAIKKQISRSFSLVVSRWQVQSQGITQTARKLYHIKNKNDHECHPESATHHRA